MNKPLLVTNDFTHVLARLVEIPFIKVGHFRSKLSFVTVFGFLNCRIIQFTICQIQRVCLNVAICSFSF